MFICDQLGENWNYFITQYPLCSAILYTKQTKSVGRPTYLNQYNMYIIIV